MKPLLILLVIVLALAWVTLDRGRSIRAKHAEVLSEIAEMDRQFRENDRLLREQECLLKLIRDSVSIRCVRLDACDVYASKL